MLIGFIDIKQLLNKWSHVWWNRDAASRRGKQLFMKITLVIGQWIFNNKENCSRHCNFLYRNIHFHTIWNTKKIVTSQADILMN